ncbi:uncharacterized protein LACBIDRAFT_331771 [Laccaria bicolor S238N-H82]|uniref:Predicted protein n=1 Tax=Laccaria bicolor (strain S238N-H82 / ATCC MYA-4686) TaxID=486041 RepID=B0DQH9_LACBS|nr:uncharacterized protein LACBIDRAFT_331771 [Laccaria bicolor S238N-H82]EDR03114.1 predicted protein [Laccaria bicolor S238N-H82]|eukprot:XP_001886255.1 predicted protein [Laccaria bicolor S238N-H82]
MHFFASLVALVLPVLPVVVWPGNAQTVTQILATSCFTKSVLYFTDCKGYQFCETPVFQSVPGSAWIVRVRSVKFIELLVKRGTPPLQDVAVQDTTSIPKGGLFFGTDLRGHCLLSASIITSLENIND